MFLSGKQKCLREFNEMISISYHYRQIAWQFFSIFMKLFSIFFIHKRFPSQNNYKNSNNV